MAVQRENLPLNLFRQRREEDIDQNKDVKSTVKGGSTEAAAAIGKLIAERGKAANVSEVIFDRGSYLYHGRVKALADAAREGGLQF